MTDRQDNLARVGEAVRTAFTVGVWAAFNEISKDWAWWISSVAGDLLVIVVAHLIFEWLWRFLAVRPRVQLRWYLMPESQSPFGELLAGSDVRIASKTDDPRWFRIDFGYNEPSAPSRWIGKRVRASVVGIEIRYAPQQGFTAQHERPKGLSAQRIKGVKGHRINLNSSTAPARRCGYLSVALQSGDSERDLPLEIHHTAVGGRILRRLVRIEAELESIVLSPNP